MNNIEDVKKQVKVIVPDHWSNEEKGRFFEALVKELLQKIRFRVLGERIRFTGMEIDIMAVNLETSQRAFVECKFHKDPLSANDIDILLGKARRKNVPLAYLFSTSPLGKEANGALQELKESPSQIGTEFAFVGPEDLAEWFIDIKVLKLPIFSQNNIELDSVVKLTVLITPDNTLWVVEEKKEGLPFRATIFPTSDTCQIDIDELRSHFSRLDLWQGLEIVDGIKINIQVNKNTVSNYEADEEIVTSVSRADTFDDYRPCQPKDFVGRSELQKDVSSFLEKVRSEQTSTRIFCFSGSSGFGKSSLILKLENNFKKTRKFNKKFYLFPIDVRAAKGPLFVAKAVKSAIQQAIEDNFIELPSHTISIESTELLFSSSSIQLCLDKLKLSNKVLVIFFDQFEELFTKESLFHAFEAFRRVAFEVDSLQSNIVLGFCWRTGVSFSGDHPAYKLWHDLADKRREFRVDPFSSNESPLLLTQLSKYLGQELNRQLRRRLLEECQGIPWLLKKVCIHIYHQIKNGITQAELVVSQFNVKSLFDEDLEQLSDREKDCLKYIAENSPSEDATEKFGDYVVNSLYANRRLVIRIGQKYAVYWDIFRDYILGKSTPFIGLTYIPRTQLSTALKAFSLLKKEGSLELDKLAEKLGYNLETTKNVVLDLQNFMLAIRLHNLIKTREDLAIGKDELADYLARQLREHVIVREVYAQISPGMKMTSEQFRELLTKAYPAAKFRPKTLKTYVNRILKWLCFAGILEETDQQRMIARPINIGRQKGKSTNPQRTGIFICESTPQEAINIAMQLVREGRIDLDSKTQLKNVASDLKYLELAQRKQKGLVPSAELRRLTNSQNLEHEVSQYIKSIALSSPFLSSLSKAIKNNPSGSWAVWASEILPAVPIRKPWNHRGTKRYISAGITWLKFFDEDIHDQDIQLSLPLF